MNIVVVLGTYYPNPSPTALVADQIIKYYLKNHNVFVICQNANAHSDQSDFKHATEIYRVSHSLSSLESRIQKACRSNNVIKRGVNQVISRIIFPFRVVKNIICFPNGESWYVKKVNILLNQIHSQMGIDCLITVCAPFSAHVSGLKFKETHNLVKWCVYTPDVFSEGIKANKSKIYRALQYRRAVEWEEKVYSHADWIIHMDRIYMRHEEVKSYTANSIVLYSKMDFKQQTPPKWRNDSSIYCLYTGSFLPGIREPYFMMETFSYIFKKYSDIKLWLYGNIGYNSYFEELKHVFPNNIILHGPIDKRELSSVVDKAQVLINVDNLTEGFIPSKIYEYIATGKPIITFSHTGKHNMTLSKYPLHAEINTKMTNPESAAFDLETFIMNNYGKMISVDSLEKIYSEHTKESYEKKLDKIIS